MAEDDLPHRSVSLYLRDDSGPLVRVHPDDVPIVVAELRVALQNPIREDELPDVVEQPGRVDEVLLSLRAAGCLGDLLRVASNRSAVAGRHPVSKIERMEQCTQQTDLEACELPRAPLQLLGALLRDEELPNQILEGEENDAEQGDCGETDSDVEECDPDSEQRRRQLRRKDGHDELLELIEDRFPVEVPPVRSDDQEVDCQCKQEDAEHQQVEEAVLVVNARFVNGGMECDASDVREPQVSQEVVDQVLRRVAPAKPAEGDRDDADGGGLRSAEENHCEDEREEASGELNATPRPARAQIAQPPDADDEPEERR